MEILQDIAHKIGFEWHLAVTHLINFLIIFFILAKFAFPSLKKTINERTKKIEGGLRLFEESKELKKEAELEVMAMKKQTAHDRDTILSSAEGEGKTIVAEAKTQADNIVKDAETVAKHAALKGKGEAESEVIKNLPTILSLISKNAFGGKLNAEVNSDFIKSVLK